MIVFVFISNCLTYQVCTLVPEFILRHRCGNSRNQYLDRFVNKIIYIR